MRIAVEAIAWNQDQHARESQFTSSYQGDLAQVDAALADFKDYNVIDL